MIYHKDKEKTTVEIIVKILFYFNIFIIMWAMVGYPVFIKILGRIFSGKQLKKNYQLLPTVTVMVVAHNEEKVILEKLENIIELDYPEDKIEFLISSDNSTDKTNMIVKEFIDQHPKKCIRLYEVKERKGKTNAQNEAQKTVKTEFLVMTDANAILEKNAVRELMAAFTAEDIAYVGGKLSYTNFLVSTSSHSENNYWERDLATREIESRIWGITAGNGALYACRNKDYYDFDPIKCHDSAMPLYYGLAGKRAVVNHDAVAYEKAGEVMEDEFARKVRMSREILGRIMPDVRLLNIFHYRWFSCFYLGHRTCRYLLWIAHLILLLTNVMLAVESWFYTVVFVGQVIFYILALFQKVLGLKNKYIVMIYYYAMTVAAQWVGVYQQVTGKTKPFWEKADSTR